MSTRELIEAIRSDTEWLNTSNGGEVECISIENLEEILSNFLGTSIKGLITQL
jgi:hypothetical protein